MIWILQFLQYTKQATLIQTETKVGLLWFLSYQKLAQSATFNPSHAELIKMPCPLLISSQSDYLIWVFDRNSHI